MPESDHEPAVNQKTMKASKATPEKQKKAAPSQLQQHLDEAPIEVQRGETAVIPPAKKGPQKKQKPAEPSRQQQHLDEAPIEVQQQPVIPAAKKKPQNARQKKQKPAEPSQMQQHLDEAPIEAAEEDPVEQARSAEAAQGAEAPQEPAKPGARKRTQVKKPPAPADKPVASPPSSPPKKKSKGAQCVVIQYIIWVVFIRCCYGGAKRELDPERERLKTFLPDLKCYKAELIVLDREILQ